MSQSNSQVGDSEGSGPCAVCGFVQKLIISDSTLRKHGHSKSNPPCPGSRQLPRSSTTDNLTDQSLDPLLITSGCVTPGLPIVAPSLNIMRNFVSCKPSRTILRRISKDARPRAAAELESRLRSVLAKPEDTPRWDSLFEFASSLSQPLH